MKTIIVKVPGKIMLSGEYAVLYGGSCLAFTVDRYLTVTVKPRQGRFVLNSNLWQAEIAFSSIHSIDRRDPFIDTVVQGAHMLNLDGADIRIESELNINFGIGSSSALRLGVLIGLSALARNLDKHTDTAKLMESCWQMGYIAHTLQKKQQKLASGYDIITQINGGLLKISPAEDEWPGDIDNLTEHGRNLSTIAQFWVGGAGAKTEQVVNVTQKWLDDHHLRAKLVMQSEAHVAQFVKTIMVQGGRSQLPGLIKVTTEHRQLFHGSPFFPQNIFAELTKVPGYDHTWTIKTTGAGGEDALLLIGELRHIKQAQIKLRELGWHRLDAAFCDKGVEVIFDETGEG